MDALLAGVESAAPVVALRQSVWLYPLVNAAHILGIALLLGGVLPLDLRRLGLWAGVPAAGLERVLTTTAALGLALAILTGALLFAVGASDYAGLGVFQAKMALVALGTLNAVATRRRFLAGKGGAVFALSSLAVWLSVLGLGRSIGYLI